MPNQAVEAWKQRGQTRNQAPSTPTINQTTGAHDERSGGVPKKIQDPYSAWQGLQAFFGPHSYGDMLNRLGAVNKQQPGVQNQFRQAGLTGNRLQSQLGSALGRSGLSQTGLGMMQQGMGQAYTGHQAGNIQAQQFQDLQNWAQQLFMQHLQTYAQQAQQPQQQGGGWGMLGQLGGAALGGIAGPIGSAVGGAIGGRIAGRK